jgi:phenylalanyl-tRNA synthetase beta chain
MKVPISWLQDYIEITIPIEELAHRLTMAGLEVEEIRYVGLPLPQGKIEGRSGGYMRHETKITGLAWDPEKIVVGAILEVMPHPNADRLVLCRLDDGDKEHVVLTGAPNLLHLKGKGPLQLPLKVAYAREGAQIFDGYKAEQEVMTLKRSRIRGVDSYSMACSEKELGISEEHEGIIILDSEAQVGAALVDYMGDAVLDIAIMPNIARNANIVGVAREVAALTGAPLQPPSLAVQADGPNIDGKVSIEIREPELNPRFVFGLIEDVEIGPSPYWVQRRLRLAGMRPINTIVDATNYVMLELGEPLHAFDYDVLVERAGGGAPTIITRTAEPGERLVTLDYIERQLDDFTVLVCDPSGALAIAGVMGGAESEVSEKTKRVLLEGAAWNFINVRRTAAAQNLPSEASYRFSRGVHPAMAERGVRRGLEIMRRLSGGVVYKGLVDNYPAPVEDPTVEVSTADARRWLGIDISVEEMAEILRRLEFMVEIQDQKLQATVPDHRLDIGQGVVGMADLLEEIARIYGYDRIPETRMADALPPQRGNPRLEQEERLRDLMVFLGMQEVITYRFTSPAREARLYPPDTTGDARPYTRLLNPISSDRVVMRHSLLASVLEVAERNARLRDRMALFEIAPVFLASEGNHLPEEPLRLVMLLTGPRQWASWQGDADDQAMDFYDLKGIVDGMLAGLKLTDVSYQLADSPAFHPGKCAQVLIGEVQIGVFGELHPLVKSNYDFQPPPIIAAEFDVEVIFELLPDLFEMVPVPVYPSVLEDLAIIVDEALPAERVAEVIRQAGGSLLVSLKLFDVYRGEQIAPGQKSLAYNLEYQAVDRTLTDKEISKIRQRIIKQLAGELDANIRS